MAVAVDSLYRREKIPCISAGDYASTGIKREMVEIAADQFESLTRIDDIDAAEVAGQHGIPSLDGDESLAIGIDT